MKKDRILVVEKIHILVADDHPAFREGLCRLLEDEKDLEIVAKAEDGEQAVKLALQLKPDVVVIDVDMPKLNGIEAAKQIKAICPTIAILMVSAFSYQSYILASLRAGAAGYLLKSAPLRELISAIRLVCAGEGVFDLKATSKILYRLTAETGNDFRAFEPLNRRELDVLKLAAKGMSNRGIAEKLFISARTVQTHLVNIFGKLQVGSRTEAVLRALKEGWLSFDDLP